MSRTYKMKQAFPAAAKLAVRLLFVLVSLFFTRAEAYALRACAAPESAPVRVCFPSDQYAVSAAYLNNAPALATIDSLAALCANDPEAKLEIVSYSSPEGIVLYNQYLSEKRSAALRNHIVSRHPELKGRITILPYAESWHDLRAAVERDTRLGTDARAEMLEVIDSDRDSDEKEELLKALPAYSHFYRNFFRSFRYAEVKLTGAREAAVKTEPAAPRADSRYKLLFPENAVGFDESYGGNPSVLKAIDELLTGEEAAKITSLKIVSGSSPDGPLSENKRFSRLRGEAVRQYVAEKYPAFSDRIELHSEGEAWDELRACVDACDRLSDVQKRELLQIIDNPVLGADAKETELRSLDSWRTVRNHLIPQTRFAAVVPVYPDTTAAAPAPVSAPAAEPAPAPAPALPDSLAHAHDIVVPDAHAREDSIAVKVTDTVAVAKPVATPLDTVVPASVTVVESPAVYTKERRPLFAVSTNLLYESATVFTGFHTVPMNIGIELPLNQHWSLTGNYMATAPWHAWNNNADCVELLHADLGARWYPGGTFANPFKPKENRELLDGWYAYASMGAGYYDFERNGRGYQGEEVLGTLGLGYGLTLGNNWSLDFALGGGPVFTRYRYYIGRSNNEHLVYQYSGKLTYFGVTDAKVSLRYLIHYNKKVKVQ